MAHNAKKCGDGQKNFGLFNVENFSVKRLTIVENVKKFSTFKEFSTKFSTNLAENFSTVAAKSQDSSQSLHKKFWHPEMWRLCEDYPKTLDNPFVNSCTQFYT